MGEIFALCVTVFYIFYIFYIFKNEIDTAIYEWE